ncbi:ABC transporter ATP-binding protein [Herbaspirillum sp. YR522]|uniref:ABC transporter ATP-binding protein n=1 Tax=Herbaspirillum sp. YR522 TaxID=1144342 RepID=UPI00026F909F|nr:dipeptide ABC transporter ATP-binding protein [Herbaspirillum sp. YR522]EJN09835.1 ABC-type uncharacterized transport system, duplicated ATPase component [Herbaspirillum sp. YR522]
MSNASDSLLKIDNLNVHFGARQVVHGVSFDIKPGEKLALVGESGSGKSVIALSTLRLVPGARLSGRIDFDGTDLTSLPERDLTAVRGRDVAVIFQEPMTALNPLYTVGEQIAEVYRVKHRLGSREAWAKAVERLAETEIPEPQRRARAYPHQLSGGQRQRAMIAMALASEPRLLIADEPTTALDVSLRLQILDLLEQLQRSRGMAVLMITHDLNLVHRFADRVVVLQNGRLVEQGAVAAVLHRPQHPYTRKLLDSRPVRDLVEEQTHDDRRVLRAEHVRVDYRLPAASFRELFRQRYFNAVQDASFELAPGRTLGIIGESGSGKSTLAQAVLGLLRAQGEISICGSSWEAAKAAGFEGKKALRRRIQVVFQDPYASLSPRRNVQDIVGEALAFHEPDLDAGQRRLRVLEMLAAVGLSHEQFPGLLERHPHEFSGGQRQRIAIARALITRPEVLVLDEPTSALDVTIQKQVLTLLQKLQKTHGLSYFLITHDMEVIQAMAHEVIVMRNGNIVEYGRAQAILEAPKNPYTRALIDAAGLSTAAVPVRQVA